MADTSRQTLPLSFTVNGTRYDIEVEPHELLLDVIRKRLGLTGAKRSCDVQVCGACAVLLDGQPVSSCTLPAFETRGRSVLTAEGLADEPLGEALARAFAQHAAFQCGFCTPGLLLTAKALLDAIPTPSPDEVAEHLEGNLCRCTGYKKIVEAVLAAAETAR